MITLIDAGEAGLEAARNAIDFASTPRGTSIVVDLKGVQLLAPAEKLYPPTIQSSASLHHQQNI